MANNADADPAGFIERASAVMRSIRPAGEHGPPGMPGFEASVAGSRCIHVSGMGWSDARPDIFVRNRGLQIVESKNGFAMPRTADADLIAVGHFRRRGSRRANKFIKARSPVGSSHQYGVVHPPSAMPHFIAGSCAT